MSRRAVVFYGRRGRCCDGRWGLHAHVVNVIANVPDGHAMPTNPDGNCERDQRSKNEANAHKDDETNESDSE